MKYRILAAVFVVAAGVSAGAFGQSITATKAYVDRRYTEATNAVASIVTNEVPGGWVCTPALHHGKPIAVRLEMTNGSVGAYRPYVGDKMIGTLAASDFPPVAGSTLDWGLAWEGIEPLTAVYMDGGNALGLAMAKDVPTHETVTNIVRDNIGSVWDASLGVAWEARMHNGHLYYIAVTNRPPEVK